MYHTSESMQVVGIMEVQVKYGDYARELELFVVKGTGSSLMGCNWLQHIHLDWKSLGIGKIQGGLLSLTQILRDNNELFEEGQGTIKISKQNCQYRRMQNHDFVDLALCPLPSKNQ